MNRVFLMMHQEILLWLLLMVKSALVLSIHKAAFEKKCCNFDQHCPTFSSEWVSAFFFAAWFFIQMGLFESDTKSCKNGSFSWWQSSDRQSKFRPVNMNQGFFF